MHLDKPIPIPPEQLALLHQIRDICDRAVPRILHATGARSFMVDSAVGLLGRSIGLGSAYTETELANVLYSLTRQRLAS
jgi:hypothetical protein